MTRLLSITLLLLFSSTALADHGRWRRPRWQPHHQPQLDLERLRQLTRACQDAMEGPANEQACLDLVSRSRSPQIEQTIRACEDAMEGDPNELACIRTMTSTGLALAAVRACEDAMEGDPNELACMSSLVGSRYEPAGLVRYCEETGTGDAEELACIARWK